MENGCGLRVNKSVGSHKKMEYSLKSSRLLNGLTWEWLLRFWGLINSVYFGAVRWGSWDEETHSGTSLLVEGVIHIFCSLPRFK